MISGEFSTGLPGLVGALPVAGAALDPLALGISLAVLGMGGTLLTLYALSLVASLLKRLFPLEVGTETGDSATSGRPGTANPGAAPPRGGSAPASSSGSSSRPPNPSPP